MCIRSLPCFSVGFTWWPVYANKAVSRNGGECLWMGLCGAPIEDERNSNLIVHPTISLSTRVLWDFLTGTLKLDVRFERMWRLTKDNERCHEEGEATLLFSKSILFQRNEATGLNLKEVDVSYIQDGVGLRPILGRPSAHHARLFSYDEWLLEKGWSAVVIFFTLFVILLLR